MDLHIENAEPLLKNIFGYQTQTKSDEGSTTQSQKHVHEKEARRTRRKTDDGNRKGKEMCSSTTNSYLHQAKAMVRTAWLFIFVCDCYIRPVISLNQKCTKCAKLTYLKDMYK